MSESRVYYTFLVQVREGRYQQFQEYENQVLPLLPKHEGRVEVRLRLVKTGPQQPDEMHVVSFPSPGHMLAYRYDPDRLKHAAVFEECVEHATLIEGYSLL